MIKGKKIGLRPMELKDMEAYCEMFNSENISEKVVGWGFPVSQYEQNKWFETAVYDKNNRRFTIVSLEDDTVLGMIMLSSIDWQNRKATIGIKLMNSCPKRQGIATEAMMLLMKYSFFEVNLERLEASFISFNTASKKLYEKCGWTFEGTKRKAIYRNGTYHDQDIAGILKTEFISLIERMEI